MTALSSTVTPAPKTTNGSTTTSRPNLVSADRKTVSGATRVTPASIAALREPCAQAGQSLRPDERGVAEDHQHVVGLARELGLCRQHRMRGTAALRLHENLSRRHHPLSLGRNRIAARPHYDRGRGAAGL